MQDSNMSKDFIYEVVSKQNNETINLNSINTQSNITYVIKEHASAPMVLHHAAEDIKNITLYVHAAASCTLELLMTPATDTPLALTVYLVGEGAQVNIKAATLQQKESCSITARIVHQAKQTESNLLIQSMLLSSAQLSFNGMIEIEPHCNKSQAYQKHTTLLLSNCAQVQSIPNLEIHANDVHCAHASATGQINQEHIAFLGQRGINESTARELIMSSFFSSIFESKELVTKMNTYISAML